MPDGHAYTRTIHTDANGRATVEEWCIQELATLGRAAVSPDPIPIREVRTLLAVGSDMRGGQQ